MKRTKKLIATLFTTLLACLCVLFSGCQFNLLPSSSSSDANAVTLPPSSSSDANTVAGIYKVKTVSSARGETTQEVHVGETVDGITLTEDFMKIILSEDGFVVLHFQESFGKGTWSQLEEGKIVIYDEYTSQEIALAYDSSTITFQPMEGLKVVLEKKAVTPSATQEQAMGCYQLKNIIKANGETFEISANINHQYDWSFIITEDGCGYFFESYNGFLCNLAPAENGKLSISVALGETDVLVGEFDGTKITATLDGRTYVFEK